MPDNALHWADRREAGDDRFDQSEDRISHPTNERPGWRQ